jgi:hypothetical protein
MLIELYLDHSLDHADEVHSVQHVIRTHHGGIGGQFLASPGQYQVNGWVLSGYRLEGTQQHIEAFLVTEAAHRQDIGIWQCWRRAHRLKLGNMHAVWDEANLRL